MLKHKVGDIIYIRAVILKVEDVDVLPYQAEVMHDNATLWLNEDDILTKDEVSNE